MISTNDNYYINGPISIYIYKFNHNNIEKTLYLFGDEHDRINSCTLCDVRDCIGIKDFLSNLITDNSKQIDFFLETEYMTKSQRNDNEYVTNLKKKTFDRKEQIGFMGNLRYDFFDCFYRKCENYPNVNFHYTDMRHQSFILPGIGNLFKTFISLYDSKFKQPIDKFGKIVLAKLLYTNNHTDMKKFFNSFNEIFISGDFVNSLIKFINGMYIELNDELKNDDTWLAIKGEFFNLESVSSTDINSDIYNTISNNTYHLIAIQLNKCSNNDKNFITNTMLNSKYGHVGGLSLGEYIDQIDIPQDINIKHTILFSILIGNDDPQFGINNPSIVNYNDYIYNLYITCNICCTILFDIYVLARMLRLDNKSNKIIFYGGQDHVINYKNFINNYNTEKIFEHDEQFMENGSRNKCIPFTNTEYNIITQMHGGNKQQENYKHKYLKYKLKYVNMKYR